MEYKNIIEATFVKRINRFISICNINNSPEKVYVPNTGRCKELFIEGRKVYLSCSDDPLRKTKYTLISIYKDDLLINIDSQAPNKLVEEAILNKKILAEYSFSTVKREAKFNNSRLDFYLEGKDQYNTSFKAYLEVKGVTLENNGHATFPDAPTLRGLKHLRELSLAIDQGFRSFVVFVIQMENMKDFVPNRKMQPEFADELKNAINNGIICKCFSCSVTENSVNISDEIPLGQF